MDILVNVDVGGVLWLIILDIGKGDSGVKNVCFFTGIEAFLKTAFVCIFEPCHLFISLGIFHIIF